MVNWKELVAWRTLQDNLTSGAGPPSIMLCASCGHENPETAVRCLQCGTPLIPVAEDQTIDSGAGGVSDQQFEKSPRAGASPSSRTPGSESPPQKQTAGGRRSRSGILEKDAELGPRFVIERLLGEGGMGRVYKVYDRDLDRYVALKVLQPELTSDPQIIQRFKQELLLASKISHKNILRIHDLSEADGVKFISMAFVEGEDLHHLLKKEHPFPLERSLKIARQLCKALDAAHAEGVVHRDFKPHNVLVAKNDHVYVSDFGLATSFETAKMGMTRTGAFVGTPRYMSPEQVEGSKVDHRSDLYSLGLVIYEMVTGDLPFSGDSTWQLMYQRVKEKPKDPRLINPELPEWVTRIVLHCLERQPENRYQSAKEIIADIDAHRSPSQSQGILINLKSPAMKWGALTGASILLIAGLFFAIPTTRHLVFRGSSGSLVGKNGLPPLSAGKFIAVLPFRVLGSESTFGYVAEGLDEALSAKLFQMNDVRIASPSEAAGQNDQKTPLPQIARNLGVNLIVHGLIEGSGDQVRIIVNLENMENNKLQWSHEFSGVTGDLLTIEDQIYAKLADALDAKPATGALAAHPTENVEAYDLYLRGRNALRGSQDPKNVRSAIDFFDSAIKRDSGFALAYSGLADASLVMYHETKDNFWSQKALASAQQAQRLNDNIPEVHFSLGSVYSATGKTMESIVQLKRALELAPNSDEGYRRLGNAYLANNQKSEAITAYDKAISINPYYWINENTLGGAYFQLGQYDNALAAFRKVVELEPNNVLGYSNIGAVYLQEGNYRDSIPMFQKALAIDPRFDTYSNLGTAYFYLKEYPEAVKMFEKAVEINPNQEVAMGNLADGYRWAGKKELAQATYDKAIALAFKELEVNPRQAGTLGSLALYYAKKGDGVRALDFVRRAREIDSNNINLIYIQAIVDDLSGESTEALQSLRIAFQKGYPTGDALSDPELNNLKSNPEFQGMLKEFSQKKH